MTNDQNDDIEPDGIDIFGHENADRTAAHTAPRRRNWTTTVAAAAAIVAVLAVLAVGGGVYLATHHHSEQAAATTVNGPVHQWTKPTAFHALPLPQKLALPLANYRATISGLIPVTTTITGPVQVGTVKGVTALYAKDRVTPVARLDKTDFLNHSVTVVVTKTDGAWSKILTPSRVTLPSADKHHAPAQSAAWVRSSDLTSMSTVSSHVDVELAAQKLTVTSPDGATRVFPVAVGTNDTPTPSNVSGYLEARYVDPSQGTGTFAIQMASLHSSVADTPVPGGIGGVIAMHYYNERTGAISHGCLRLDADGVNAVNALPLGSIITIH